MSNPPRTPTRRALTIAALAAFAAATALTACEHDPRPKQRPAGVPLSAQWAGTNDGGAYFDCSAGEANYNQCTVWDDGTGAIKLEGKFQIEGKKRPAYASELNFKSSDSNSIYLDNNLTLKKVG